MPGWRAKASFVPSGLTAGSAPDVIIRGRPPASDTDSISPRQPCLAAKYTVRPSGETATAPPATPPRTRMRLASPDSGSSTTSAPFVVTATMSGRPWPPVTVGGADGVRPVAGAATPGWPRLA